MQLSVRDVNDEIFKEFKSYAVKNGLKLGNAINMALDQWIENKRDQSSFLDLKPFPWGKGTEKTSKEIDKILYGD
ncbi:MAG: hypothetical protein ISS48_01765 [Candidatus Aenigmarchaeota archaeon]|nr:hypothetical protein [Candidatus Aenigmarchaeota archaeon]